jgi:hypothetical protein
MPKHFILIILGFIIGLAVVFVVRPDTNEGTTALVVVSIAIVYSAGLLVTRLFGGSSS